MKSLIEEAAANLLWRYAECEAISAELVAPEAGSQLIGTFTARADGITRVFTVPVAMTTDPDSRRSALLVSIAVFEENIAAVVRRKRTT